jgi:hypothetical protein
MIDETVDDLGQQIKNKPSIRNRKSNEKAELNNDDDVDDQFDIKKMKKGSNLNHLLNFKFLRQEPYHLYERDFKSGKFDSTSNTKLSRSMIFTKEMFLQAK